MPFSWHTEIDYGNVRANVFLEFLGDTLLEVPSIGIDLQVISGDSSPMYVETGSGWHSHRFLFLADLR